MTPRREAGTLMQKRRRALYIRLGIIGALVILVLGAIAYLSRLPGVTVSEIIVEGESAVPESRIADIARESMRGSWFFIIPKNNAFFYPGSGIEQELPKQETRIERAEVRAKEMTSILITIVERVPDTLWCSPTDECFFIDVNGLIFSPAPSYSGNAYFRFYAPLPNPEMPAEGQQLLPRDEFARFTTFTSRLRSDAKIIPESLSFDTAGEVRVTLARGGDLVFHRDQDLSFVLDNVISVFSSPEFKEEDQGNLEYADFRFGDKVYFKFH